ncbi:MAG TPA: alpha-amylase family glycosyl hydrolase [Xanthobacteraceae bacterium]|nr:alpha-amylase family glycosyl hydrolase [Xanthobacteraceae bacterium]
MTADVRGTAAPPRFGPVPVAGGTLFQLWAPQAGTVELEIEGAAPRCMEAAGEGHYRLQAPAAPGTAYRFRVDGRAVPDPASHGQRDEPDGWSLVPGRYRPPGRRRSRPWHESVLAEIHVGAATVEGTFRALIDRLDHYRDAGFTVLELMPVAAFAGRWNWGYDGVLPYAPDRSYGTPAELRALVDAAHARGLSMMLDVVYNHFGPAGDFLPFYAGVFYRDDMPTPWGPAINLENPTVRAFFVENAQHWLRHFDFDGLRFDAVHAFTTAGAQTLLRELAAGCRAVKPDAFLVLENHDNVAGWLTQGERLYTAQWNDDWHHVAHHIATGEARGYYAPYAADPVGGIGRALAEGFVFQGEPYPGPLDAPRGTASGHLRPDAFVSFVQNHDHIGNRPFGDRLTASVPAERLALLHFVLMLAPSIPLLFMGEEAGLATPFPFFCDFGGALADAVRTGRRAEFRAFFDDCDAHAEMPPDPLAAETFQAAKLRVEAFDTAGARTALAAFRDLAAKRRRLVWPLAASGFTDAVAERRGGTLAVRWQAPAGALLLVLNPTDTPAAAGCPDRAPDASVGTVARAGSGIALGAFSAALWSLMR